MNLSEFYDYKNQLMEDILTNRTLVNLLTDGACPFEDAAKLAYTQVFPYEFVPETLEHGQAFICFDVDITKSLSKTFLQPVIYVWVFTHMSKLRLPGGGVRTDQMAIEIANQINGSRLYGLGELNLESAKRFVLLDGWLGKTLTFTAVEFNRTQPTGKPIPSNRKRGLP